METETKNTKAFYITEIPSDWKESNINEMFYFKQGVQCAVDNQFDICNEGRVRFIRIVDLTASNEPIRYIDDPGKEHHVLPDDLFMIRYGTPGVLGYGYEGVIANNLFRIIPKSRTINQFYYYQLSFKERQIQKLASSSTMPALNFESLSQLKILVPPLPEQKAIAQVLSTADAAIHTTEKLIARKELRKKWLMQQLLTGKKRLKGFGGEWKKCTASEFFSQRNEQAPNNGNIPLFSLTIEHGVTEKSDRYEREFLVKDKSIKNYKIVYPNDIVFNPANLRWGAIAKHTRTFKVLLSPIYEVLTVKQNFDIDFISYLVSSPRQIAYYASILEGTLIERMAVKVEPFLATKYEIPNQEEQIAIAKVLKAVDKEISLLKAKAEKLREQKKGLMQVLLTGKVRLEINNK